MRTMRYTAYTRCLTPAIDGEILTLGSRDKYWFESNQESVNAELYIFRFNDGRNTKVDAFEYEIKADILANCGDDTDITMETGDIILGISSVTVPEQQGGGAGCTPCIYRLRPLFKRNSGSQRMPRNLRSCAGGS